MKQTTVLLLALVLALVGTGAVNAQAAAYPAELEYYDAQIDLLLPRLESFQWQYHAINGRFFQALESHTSAPDVPTVPDGIQLSPTDQPEALAYFWQYAGLPLTLAWSYRIDTYSGPDGDGYVLSVQTLINGETWQRAVNYGPDTWRSADWYLVQPEF